MREYKYRFFYKGKRIEDNLSLREIGSRCEFHWDDDVKIVEYTGLKDKNGKEIFEGDIVENQALVDSVITMEGVVTLTRSGYDKFFVKQPLAVHDGLEVIGNIYEHSYLLDTKT